MGLSKKLSLIALFLVVGFQACGKAAFSKVGAASSDSTNGTLGTPVVCDPFSATAACGGGGPGTPGGPGLLGNVYHYPNGRAVDDYINKGTRLAVLVQLSHLDIPVRSWTTGFPTPSGGILDDAGDLLIEYFALDLTGFYQQPPTLADGDYQMAIASDDGAILEVDGKVVVNNDGTHPVQWKCAPKALHLAAADKHDLHLKYYQGPRVEIALQVFLRPWSDHVKPCDASGGFQIIPADGLSH